MIRTILRIGLSTRNSTLLLLLLPMAMLCERSLFSADALPSFLTCLQSFWRHRLCRRHPRRHGTVQCIHDESHLALLTVLLGYHVRPSMVPSRERKGRTPIAISHPHLHLRSVHLGCFFLAIFCGVVGLQVLRGLLWRTCFGFD